MNPNASAGTPAVRERILLVEDNPEVQEVTAAFLEELGYRVSLADNADAALVLLASC